MLQNEREPRAGGGRPAWWSRDGGAAWAAARGRGVVGVRVGKDERGGRVDMGRRSISREEMAVLLYDDTKSRIVIHLFIAHIDLLYPSFVYHIENTLKSPPHPFMPQFAT